MMKDHIICISIGVQCVVLNRLSFLSTCVSENMFRIKDIQHQNMLSETY